ncbi:MAG: efflux RND transporter periplasmic adaptor subunit [Anaerolineales bacterium]|nr:efflux RND transporter periplasmic adaptor subunit [Anaerolineales bacterium]
MNNFRQIIKLLLTILIGILVVSACSSLAGQETPTPEPIETEEIPPLITATGEVRPAQWSHLSLSMTGIVEEVLVKEGDPVEAGQVLLRLRGKEELRANIAAAEFEVIAAQTALDELYDNAERQQIDQLKAIAVAADQVRDAQYQLDNYIPPQEQAEMDPMQAFDLMWERLDAARQAFEPYKYFSSNNEMRKELKEDLDEAQSDYNSAVKRLEYEHELAVAKAKLEEAREDYETFKAGPDSKDLVVAKARLENAQAALAAAKAATDDLELRATFNGVISELNVRAGEWVNPGQTVLVLADLEQLRVETTDLNEIDAARVQAGDPVMITFDALPGVQVNGVVESIAPKASAGTGVNYRAVILMDEWPESLRWGMTAFVDIEVE